MRKRYRVLILAAIAAALVVPVGFALSLESGPVGTRTPHVVIATPVNVSSARVVAPVTHRAATPAPRTAPIPLSDGAVLFIAGSMLFGVAAAVRRAA